MAELQKPYILGLDLGVQSAGWAVIDLDENDHPCGVRRAGVRCFDSGVGNETEIASGKDESKNVKRRQMRSQRRQLWRRARRQKKVFHLLQLAGLLPPEQARTPQQRHELLYQLDAELVKAFLPEHDRVAGHLLPYRLRAAALDQALPPFALGRAIFHLAQRRGFETNSRSAAKNEKETGPVKKGIGELGKQMQEANARTLGEYFAGLDPEEKRIRQRWTARKMYRDEFEAIWTAQSPHHPTLGAEWKKRIHDAIFHQRPLKSQKGLVGMCELEPDCRRAPLASLEAQRFRYLQKANDLEISTPDSEVWRLNDPEHAELRKKLIELLDARAKITFQSLRTELGLEKDKESGRNYRFNFEAEDKRLPGSMTAAKLRKMFGDDYLQKIDDVRISTPSGEVWGMTDPEHAALRKKLVELVENDSGTESLKSRLELIKPQNSKKDYVLIIDVGGDGEFPGNATAAKLRNILGADYEKFTPEQLSDIVDDLLEYEKRDALVERFVNRYKISPVKASALADLTLTAGYVSFSRRAIQKLLPRMESGCRLASLTQKELQELFPNRRRSSAKHELLPPVLEAVPQLRNPVVCRGLTELRKVVNGLIRQYGKPEMVRVELARDLKRSRKQREKITEQNEANKYARDAARKKTARRLSCDEDSVSDLDVLKVRLADECNWECPYTGRPISMETLVGKDSQFDIEHIIPFSRSLDNSFTNKTLCDPNFNRHVKKNGMPHETCSSNGEEWQKILARVRRFRGPAGHAKLRKFQQQKPDEDFATRMLQDTRYMSRLATEYLGLLYGGTIDADHKQRVQVSSGRMTGYLRDEWGLNAILADGDEDAKNRSDHRHHAVDAAVIALTDASTVQILSRSAEVAAERGHRLFAVEEIHEPWPTFLDDVRKSINTVNVSYRANRRVSGRLHEDTLYSRPHSGKDKKGKDAEYFHVRKLLKDMTPGMIDAIVDDTIRELVQEKVKQMGGFRKGMFADEANHPYMKARNGRFVPIHKARIRQKKEIVLSLGKDYRQRRADPGRNHHMEILARIDEHGDEAGWDGKPVGLFDAYQRVKNGKPVICRDHEPNTKFLFSLAINEYMEMDDEQGNRALYRIVSIWQQRVEFRLHTDARPSTIIGKTPKGRVTRSPAQMRECNARKVVVDPLGNVLPAND